MERSSTDWLSNRTTLRGFSQPREIALAALGIYPPETLPQFLHELTHHWCFESPVGLAVALLQIEAAALTIRGSRTRESRERAQQCLIRAAVVSCLLGPIVEGMALFAEFDLMTTGHGQLVSSPVSLIADLYADGEFEMEDGRLNFRRKAYLAENENVPIGSRLLTPFDAPFLSLRISSQLIDRKSNLLSSEFTIHGDAYLLGYLIIKSTWVRSFTRFWRMFDTDLFQLVIRSLIFGDNTLVSMLLSHSSGKDLTVPALAGYIERRLVELQRSSLEPFAIQMEQANKERPRGRFESLFAHAWAPWEDNALPAAANDAVSRTIDRLAKSAISDAERMFVDLAEALLSQRLAMKVLSVNVGFELNGKRLVITYGDTTVYAMDVNSELARPTGEGQFAVYVLPTTGLQFCVLQSSEAQLLLHQIIRDGWDPTSTAQFDVESVIKTVVKEEVLQGCKMALETAEKHSGINWDKTLWSIRQAALPTYSRLALSFAKDTTSVHSKMQQAGFWTLLDGNTMLLEYLARLSCWSSLTLPLEIQEGLCRAHGFTVAEASEQLLEYCAANDFQFFALDSYGRPISLA